MDQYVHLNQIYIKSKLTKQN